MIHTIQRQDLTFVYTIANGHIVIFQKWSGQEGSQMISVSHQQAKALVDAIIALIPEAKLKQEEHSRKELE